MRESKQAIILATVLVVIVLGSVIFTFVSPWWFTPLASNWGQIDTTLIITLIVTGIAFVAVNLFVAYVVVRYRRREGRQASFIPEHKRLEQVLIWVTAIGIVLLLAPGLLVYSRFIRAPQDALLIEVIAEQWKWSYRFPGEDGKLGQTDPKRFSPQNPYGIDPEDKAAQDDLLILGSEVHLPVGRPIKLQLRSKDVLHSFYVPNFRVKMDAVPGMVTHVWFTPTKTGRFEIACAEFCGIGHFRMRGVVVVEGKEAFANWLQQQPTFAKLLGTEAADLVERGKQLAQANGCLGCHTTDGRPSVGPTWLGLYGRVETLQDGSTVTVDEAYLKEAILDPNAKIVKGFPPAMPAFETLSDEELQALIAFIKSLSDQSKEGGS